jgi:hypothetical protein
MDHRLTSIFAQHEATKKATGHSGGLANLLDFTKSIMFTNANERFILYLEEALPVLHLKKGKMQSNHWEGII